MCDIITLSHYQMIILPGITLLIAHYRTCYIRYTWYGIRYTVCAPPPSAGLGRGGTFSFSSTPAVAVTGYFFRFECCCTLVCTTGKHFFSKYICGSQGRRYRRSRNTHARRIRHRSSNIKSRVTSSLTSLTVLTRPRDASATRSVRTTSTGTTQQSYVHTLFTAD